MSVLDKSQVSDRLFAVFMNIDHVVAGIGFEPM